MFNETEIKQRPFSGHKMHQIRFRQGLRPGPRWRSSRRSPDPLVGWGGGHPLPISPFPLSAYGASILTPSAFDSAPSAPRLQRSATSFFTV